jgi:glycosyltransferase involved in cell wall biosynthesis
MPHLSIITINYNNSKGLRKTIETVRAQTFKDYEYIIIDGGSTDESVDIIKENSEYITYWVSEKDGGVYNAMNKGILKAKGEYCYFLNSGDYLWTPDVLERVFQQSNSEDIVYGNMINNRHMQVNTGFHPLSFYDLFVHTIYHQSAFIKRALFDKVGLYSEHFKVISDWEFFIKAICLERCSYLYVNIDIAVYEVGGISFQDPESNERDRHIVLRELFPFYYDDYQSLKKYKQSNFVGIFDTIENNKLVRSVLGGALSFSRFVRFNILRQKRKTTYKA